MKKSAFYIVTIVLLPLSFMLAETQTNKVISSPVNTVNIVDSGVYPDKIAIVDFIDAAEQSAQGGQAREQMKERAGKMGSELKQEEQKITQAATEFKAKAATMNEIARDKEEQRIKKMQREYTSKAQEYEEEIKRYSEELMKEISQEFRTAATVYAKDNNFDAIIDRATGQFVYVADHMLCTSEVVKIMNKQHDTKIAQSKTAAKQTTTVSTKAAPKTTA